MKPNKVVVFTTKPTEIMTNPENKVAFVLTDKALDLEDIPEGLWGVENNTLVPISNMSGMFRRYPNYTPLNITWGLLTLFALGRFWAYCNLARETIVTYVIYTWTRLFKRGKKQQRQYYN